MIHTRLTRLSLVFASALGLCCCASLMGPPTGIVRMNDAKNFGTYRWNDGARYEGGFKDGKFDGKGTVYFRRLNEMVYDYDQSRDPVQFDGGSLTSQFANGNRLVGPATFTVLEDNIGFVGFTYEGEMANGTRGQGRVTFKDGRVFVGHFDYTPAPYSWLDRNAREQWSTHALLGSKITGAGTWTWPDGSVFTGATYDYYLFNRSTIGMQQNCAQSQFVGQGTLKVPGKPDYVGLVGESYDHSRVAPITQQDFDEIVDGIASCPAQVAAERRRGEYLQAQFDASMAQARQDAHNMLMRDLAAMPAQTANTLAEVSAASRGTSVEAEQAKARRDTQFYAAVAAEQEDPDSQYNQNKRAEEQRRAAEELAVKERRDVSEAQRRKREEATAGAADADRATEEQQKAEKKRKEDADLKAQQDRDAKRLAEQQQAAESIRREQKKRAEEEEAYQEKVAKDQQERDEAFAKQKYLNTMASSIKLAARHCPDGKGMHYVVGLRPVVKPTPVSCIDVHYTASCPGTPAGSLGTISSFLGAGTDCFFGDAAAISPTPSCEPKDVRVQVTRVAACGE